MRIWPLRYTNTSASPLSERMDYDRVIAGAPSGAHIITPFSMLHRAGPWYPMPGPIQPGCSNKENNGGFPCGTRAGRGIGSYSSRCRFTVSTMRSPQVTLRSVPLYSLCTLDGIINHFAEPLNRKRILYAPFVPVIDGNDRWRRRSSMTTFDRVTRAVVKIKFSQRPDATIYAICKYINLRRDRTTLFFFLIDRSDCTSIVNCTSVETFNLNISRFP